MSKKIFWGLIAALVLVVAWGAWERSSKIQTANALEANYQRAFYDTISLVEQTEVLLAKCLASSSDRQQLLYLAEISNRADGAQASLAQLPLDVNLASSRKFLAQLGDYSFSLAGKLSGGEPLENKEKDQLAAFQAELGAFGKELHNMEKEMMEKRFRWTAAEIGGPQLEAKPKAEPLDGFVNVEKRLQEMPTLTYDGPFSDHLERRKPLGITGEVISQEKAQEKAVGFIENAENFRLAESTEVDGKIPSYSFLFKARNGNDDGLIIDISKQGGHVITLINDRLPGEQKLSSVEALRKAESFLKFRNLDDMIPSYSFQEAGAQVISFVYKQDDVVIYPDLINVQVSLDNGEIIGFEALGFRMAHHERQLDEPALAKEDIRNRVSENLAVQNIRPALIPLDGGQEVLTYEVHGTIKDEDYLIYHDVQTGDEIRIKKIIHLTEGELAM